ncbi:hypothetical protein JOF55_004292 [Haloactinomyces albus]|uniref:Uncharacterized protein n=1 Tax=Haloactinomyces albus TaxID=1352928 RepID=A0AAE3ZHP3_9ACTN|nr:hypothetical protein [Haloactinomyces albus]
MTDVLGLLFAAERSPQPEVGDRLDPEGLALWTR